MDRSQAIDALTCLIPDIVIIDLKRDLMSQIQKLIGTELIIVPRSPRTPTEIPKVMLKTQDYFLLQKCYKSELKLVPVDDLYESYRAYMIESNSRPVVRNTFEKSLERCEYLVTKLNEEILLQYPATNKESRKTVYTNAVPT